MTLSELFKKIQTFMDRYLALDKINVIT